MDQPADRARAPIVVVGKAGARRVGASFQQTKLWILEPACLAWPRPSKGEFEHAS